MQPLVGADRRELVARLEKAFGDVARWNGSEGLILVADSGQGKTRVVQEFYERLAQSQRSPGFWPMQIAAANEEHIGELIGPRLRSVPHESLPDWLWLPLACRTEADGQTCAMILPEALAAVERVAPWLAVVERHYALRLGNVPRALAQNWENVFDDTSSVVGALGAFGLSNIVPIGGPALFAVASALKRAVDRAQPAVAQRTKRRHAQVNLPNPAVAAAARAADHIVRLSRALPVILMIEDLHYADDVTGEFLRRTLARRGRILVVATGWPRVLHGPDMPPAIHVLLDGAVEDRLSFVSMARLPRSELRVLVHRALPRLGNDAVDAMLDAYPNPQILSELLRLPVIRRAVRTGTLTEDVTRQLINEAYDTVADIARAQWSAFREDVRQALSALAVSAPGRYWPRAAAASVLKRLNLANPDEVLALARDPYGWLRRVDDDIDGFVERVHMSVASARAAEYWRAEEVAHAQEAWVEWYVATRESSAPTMQIGR